MKHVATISSGRGGLPGKAIDSSGTVFLAIWAAVLGAMLTAAFTKA